MTSTITASRTAEQLGQLVAGQFRGGHRREHPHHVPDDGVLGLAAIRAYGGTTLCQSPDDALFP